MLSVIMLSVIMLSVIMLSFIMPSAIMMNVVNAQVSDFLAWREWKSQWAREALLNGEGSVHLTSLN